MVHIDDEGLCGQSVDDRNNVKQHIEELSRLAGFPYHSVSLADLFIQQDDETCIELNLQDLGISNEEQNISSEVSKRIERLRELFDKVTTVTAKEDLLSHLYHNLLQKTAKDHGYDYIMIGDCSTNIAVRILADVAQGRGSQLPFNVSFKDSRSEVLVLRPMREFTKKEIEFYNRFNNVTSFTIPSFTTKASSHGSVNRLTEELIIGLQAGFPSTVNTVLKTGDKISSNVDSKDNQHCALCLAPLDIHSGFSEILNDLTTCGSGECGGGCQKDGGNTGNDDGSDTGGADGNSSSCQKSDGGNDIAIDGTSVHSGTLGSDGTLRGSDGHSGTLGSVGDGTLRGSDGTLGGGDGALKGSSGHSDYTRWSHQTTNDHNIVLKSLCYGCKLTYQDIKDEQMLLPKFVTENSRKQFQQRTMKEQIQEFLLDG